ncbi:MAG: DUF2066 domain-containing protein [Pseudomonadales bacterium]
MRHAPYLRAGSASERLRRLALPGALAGALLLCALLPATAPAAEVPWLYDVEVPVEDQSTLARLDAAGRALAQLLTRLTGLSSVPRNEAVSRALAAPDLYYNRFGFERAADGESLRLRLQFAPQTVLGLIRDANLPIWGANRPSVLAWVVVDDGSERRILGAGSDEPLIAALAGRALERGLPLRLPLLDLTDQLAVEPAAVWGRLSSTLLPASARYAADIVLVGRARLLDDQRWSADWQFWVDGDIRELRLEARAPEPLGHAAVDLVADELAGRYAVLDRGTRRVDLNVSALYGAVDYAELLRYLGGLEFVQDMTVSSVSGDRLGVSLLTAAGPEQLLELFRLDQRLFPDQLNDAPGGAIALVWKRR